MLSAARTGADDQDRTGDLVLTKDVLCQLSYIGLRACGASADESACHRRRILDRTRGSLAYQPKPARHTKQLLERRLERETGIEPATNSLEGCDSTTELLPPSRITR